MRLVATILLAYAVPQTMANIRVIGGPKWIDEERYDITAKVDGPGRRSR